MIRHVKSVPTASRAFCMLRMLCLALLQAVQGVPRWTHQTKPAETRLKTNFWTPGLSKLYWIFMASSTGRILYWFPPANNTWNIPHSSIRSPSNSLITLGSSGYSGTRFSTSLALQGSEAPHKGSDALTLNPAHWLVFPDDASLAKQGSLAKGLLQVGQSHSHCCSGHQRPRLTQVQPHL